MPWWRRRWALAQPNVEADWLSSGAWRSWEPPLNIVRGESHRQQALLEVAGPPRVSGYLLPVEVTFCREPHNPHDRNAFRAEVAGQHIGYLARELAAMAAKPLDRARCERFSVAGVVRGGSTSAPALGVHVWERRRLSQGPEIQIVGRQLFEVQWPPSEEEGIDTAALRDKAIGLVDEHPDHYSKTSLVRALGYTEIALGVVEELLREGMLGPTSPVRGFRCCLRRKGAEARPTDGKAASGGSMKMSHSNG